jgi:segregation and condensation protein B
MEKFEDLETGMETAGTSQDESSGAENGAGEAQSDAPPPDEEQTSVPVEELLASPEEPSPPEAVEDARLAAILEALVYIAEEPLTLVQISSALQQPRDRVRTILERLIQDYEQPNHGITIREVAGGYKMATKAEHHDSIRGFVKSLTPALKLSLPALETLSVIAYKQPVTGPEIMEIRGVQGAGVIKTLLDRKLIAVAGRKNVVGKPILYKTTKEFLIQFGLKDLNELPSVKELDEIQRMAVSEPDGPVSDDGLPPLAESGATDEAAMETSDVAAIETGATDEPDREPAGAAGLESSAADEPAAETADAAAFDSGEPEAADARDAGADAVEPAREPAPKSAAGEES